MRWLTRGRHAHDHDPARERRHPHDSGSTATATFGWTLFLIFAFGPCESLIPLWFYPVATR